ncbi:alcohol dehydrogenase transcription factor myb/SANT-like domain-containing protein [Phthorimaea operculella]|nr:alcohol dehydrogenase transcription factor myb/SANT-like domain-containing protein [Phthorimaea operculella]
MEWSKDKTLKLIELLQVNASLWNPSLCDTRREKQKRREELRSIADVLGVSVPDITKKIQHLRTQYNRESAREARANAEDPSDRYVSNWYAFEYLHFMKDSTKPYRIIQPEDHNDLNNSLPSQNNSIGDCKLLNLSPLHKSSRNESSQSVKSELVYPSSPRNRDEFSVFGEYVANELRSLKGEKNLLVAKKKIQDVIFEVKMGMICEPRTENPAGVYTSPALQGGKVFSSQVMNNSVHVEPLPSTHVPPTSGINEIIINGACHYTNFKVDSQ